MILSMAILAALTQGPAGDSLTIDGALAHARSNRPQVAVASGTTARARAAMGIAGLIPNPVLQLEFDRNAPTRKAVVAQSLDWLLRRGEDRAFGRAGIVAGIADSAEQIADLSREVRTAFYRALGAQELTRLVGDQARLADSIAHILQRRLDAGDVSSIERDQATQEAGRMRLVASRARQDAATARVALHRAMGLLRDTLPPGGPLDAGLTPDALSHATDLAAIDDMPRVRRALGDSAGAHARLRSASLARIPVPSIIGGIEWGPHETPTNRIIGFAVPVSLFNIGGAARAEASAMAQIAATGPAEARLSLRADIDDAQIRRDGSAARARFIRDTLLPTARRLRSGTVRLLDEGRIDLLPVLDALRNERDAAQALINELVAFQAASADYLALIGRNE